MRIRVTLTVTKDLLREREGEVHTLFQTQEGLSLRRGESHGSPQIIGWVEMPDRMDAEEVDEEPQGPHRQDDTIVGQTPERTDPNGQGNQNRDARRRHN